MAATARLEFVKNLLFTSLEFGVKSPLNLKSLDAVKSALELIIRGTSLSLYLNEEDDEIATTPIDTTLLEPNTDEKLVSLTLSGAIFVVDVLLNAKSGTVSQVSLSGPNSISPLANEYLTTLLKEYRFVEFERAIRLICFLDAFKCPDQIDMLSLLSGLETDSSNIYQKESGNGKKVVEALFKGHGFPRLYKDTFGPSIVYFSFSPRATLSKLLLKPTLSASDGTFSALVSVEASGKPSPFNPSTRAQSLGEGEVPATEQHLYGVGEMPILGSVVRAFTPLPGSEMVANACFCLDLVPGVAMSPLAIAQVNSAGNGLVFAEWDENSASSTFESLYFVQQSDSSAVAVSCSTNTILYNVSKIKFTHLTQMYTILKGLRQAVVFNKLAESLFKSGANTLTTLNGSSKARLVAWSPPQNLQFIFLHKRPPFRYSLQIGVDLNGVISLLVSESSGTPLQIDFLKNKVLAQALVDCNGLAIVHEVQTLLHSC